MNKYHGSQMANEAYCVKCKSKKEMKDVSLIVNGNRAREVGLCTTCNTKMSKFVKAPAKASK
jgi:hypothetical protein